MVQSKTDTWIAGYIVWTGQYEQINQDYTILPIKFTFTRHIAYSHRKGITVMVIGK